MSQITSIDLRCDVAVAGAGPVGIMTACLIKALNKDYIVKVFDKRPTTTRDHALSIGADSIDKIHTLCGEHLARSSSSIDKPLLQELVKITEKWKKRHIRTSKIEETLAQLVRGKIEVFRGPQYKVTASQFQNFLESTKAQIVIGADGAKDSQVREAIGATKVEEPPVSFLLELKYTTTPASLERSKLQGSTQALVAEGWDFETMSRKEEGKSTKRATLHKFVDEETHRALLVAQDGSVKGTTEHPWTFQELSDQAKQDPKVQWVTKHIRRYFRELVHSDEKIVTFPLVMFRSTHVVKLIGNQLVVLAGDSSAGIVLERGVNKGLIEAAFCARAVTSFFTQNSAREPIHEIPPEFKIYEQETLSLYKTEKRWALGKAFGLRISEILLKIAIAPFKWVFKSLQFLASGVRASLSVFK